MDKPCGEASRGLTYLFGGQILSILVFLPTVGWVAGIAGLVISILGFRTLSRLSQEYYNAFILEIANLILTVVYALTENTILVIVLSIVTSLLTMLSVIFVCMGTGDLLRGINDRLSKHSQWISKIYLFTTIIMVICILLSYLPLTGLALAAWGLALVASAVQLAGAVLYLIFLWKSQKALAAWADNGY